MKTYLINIVGTNLYKIGRSIEPEQRLGQLGACQPYEYRIVAVCGTDIELRLHRHFAKYKHKAPNSKEWFCFDNQCLRQVFLMYAQPELLDKRAKPGPDKAEVAELVCEILGLQTLDEPFNIVVYKQDVYSHPLFDPLKAYFKGLGNARQTWFWRRCLGEYFGFSYKLFGKRTNGKYRIQNLASE